MTHAQTIVANLTASQSIAVLRQLNQDLFTLIPYPEVLANVAEEDAELSLLRDLEAAEKQTSVDVERGGELARALLTTFAKDPVYAPYVEKAWDSIRSDDSLFVIEAITLGLLVNLTLLVATTEIEITDGKVTARKRAATPELVKAVLSPVTEVAKAWVGAK